MRYPKLRELKEAVKALIKGPYTNKFPFKPHEPFERFRGRPEFHVDDCIGCTACAQVCPSKVIDVEDSKDKRCLTIHWDICIFCGQCQANCPTGKGIMLSREFDLATTGKRQELKQSIEKELVSCDCCGEAVAPLDQILWVAKKIGPLLFSNVSLFIFYLNSSFPGAKLEQSQKEDLEFLRPDRSRMLCPRCRREAVVKS